MLEISDLKKSYTSGKSVLDGIDLTINPQEFVVIIGKSGAGKTTLLRCINLLTTPSEGKIFFEGRRIDKLRGEKLRKLRASIGMIFQNYNLIGRSNVMQNVLNGKLGQVSFFKSALGLYNQSELKEAHDLLKTVGLEEFIHSRAQDLSGGQMQRVGICRAMMQNPKLLLADEPIASLDPANAELVMDHIANLTKTRGLTGIVSLHQVDFAKKYANRIVGLCRGKIVYDGPPGELTEEVVRSIYD